MGLFGKGKKSVRFDFTVHVHSLSPWPAQYKAIAIAWERGQNRKGSTKPVAPTTQPGRLWNSYEIEESFRVPCTLYQESNKRGEPVYEKKWLVLAVVEADGRGRSGTAREVLGRVAVNLADFAADNDQGQRAFAVACNKSISAAVGEAKMVLTIGCRSKGSGATEGMDIRRMTSSRTNSFAATASDDGSFDIEESAEGYDLEETMRATAASLEHMQSIPELPPITRATSSASAAARGTGADSFSQSSAASPARPRAHISDTDAAKRTAPVAAPAGPRYDEDGFLLEEEDEGENAEVMQEEEEQEPVRGRNSPAARVAPTAPAAPAARTAPAAHASEAATSSDDEDDFLARAVAALEHKAGGDAVLDPATVPPPRSPAPSMASAFAKTPTRAATPPSATAKLGPGTQRGGSAGAPADGGGQSGSPLAVARSSAPITAARAPSPKIDELLGGLPAARTSSPASPLRVSQSPAPQQQQPAASQLKEPLASSSNPFIKGLQLADSDSESDTPGSKHEERAASSQNSRGRGSAEEPQHSSASGSMSSRAGDQLRGVATNPFAAAADAVRASELPARPSSPATAARMPPPSDAGYVRGALLAERASDTPKRKLLGSRGATAAAAAGLAGVVAAESLSGLPEPAESQPSAEAELTAEPEQEARPPTNVLPGLPVAARTSALLAGRRGSPRSCPVADDDLVMDDEEEEEASVAAASTRSAAAVVGASAFAGSVVEAGELGAPSAASSFSEAADSAAAGGRAAPARQRSRSLLKPETASAVTANRKWMRRMKSGNLEAAAPRISRTPRPSAGAPVMPASPSSRSLMYSSSEEPFARTSQDGAPVEAAAALAVSPPAPTRTPPLPPVVTSPPLPPSRAPRAPSPAAQEVMSPAAGIEPSRSPASLGALARASSGTSTPGAAAAAAAVAAAEAATVGGSVEALVLELRSVAALEAAVHLARRGGGGMRRGRMRNIHAPARRLARTTISLGPDEGIIFGLRAIRAVEAAADGCWGDCVGMAYWWGNCIQLRWMLWAMCHGSGGHEDPSASGSLDEFSWVMQVLVPPLRELESHIFDQLSRQLWSCLLAEAARRSAADAAALKASPSKKPAANGVAQAGQPLSPTAALRKGAEYEAAIERWLDAMQVVQRTLVNMGQAIGMAHTALLRQQLLTTVLRRLDWSLFRRMVAADELDGSPTHSSTYAWNESYNGNGASSPQALEPALLPFPEGPLSFGVGVNLKMAVTRWTNWAADVGLREQNKGADEGYTLFPLLRASADLLMMPKEVLTDRAIRGEVVPGLSLRRICALLERFQPDSFSPDPLPHGLLEALASESPPAGESPASASRQGLAYQAPAEAVLLTEGLIEPVSLEMDDESEEELDSMAELYDQEGRGAAAHRYTLLKELWSSAR